MFSAPSPSFPFKAWANREPGTRKGQYLWNDVGLAWRMLPLAVTESLFGLMRCYSTSIWKTRAKTTKRSLDSTQLDGNGNGNFLTRLGCPRIVRIREHKPLARLFYRPSPWPFPAGLCTPEKYRRQTPPEKRRKPPRRASVALPGTSKFFPPTKTMRLALTPAMSAISAMCPPGRMFLGPDLPIDSA